MSYLQFNTSLLRKFILSGCGLVVVTMCFGNTNNFNKSRIPGKLLIPFVSSANSSVDKNPALIDKQNGNLNLNNIGQLFEISNADQLVSDISDFTGIPSFFILSDTPVSNKGIQTKSSRGSLAISISDCCCCCCCCC